jgi:hypothetical protein
MDCIQGAQRRLSERARSPKQRTINRQQRDCLKRILRASHQRRSREHWILGRLAAPP